MGGKFLQAAIIQAFDVQVSDPYMLSYESERVYTLKTLEDLRLN